MALAMGLACLASGADAGELLTLADARPAFDRKSQQLAVWPWNCDYGIYGWGDKTSERDRVAALRTELQAALGERLAGKQVKLLRYGVFQNATDATLAWAAATAVVVHAGGSATIDLSAKQSKCDREKTRAGWFASAELTSPYTPFIAELSVEIDGVVYSARALRSPDEPVHIMFVGPVNQGLVDVRNRSIEQVSRDGRAALIAELQAKLP